ncbi:alpha/beta hydrolase [Fictibacillus macauensis ZFHKF-1]|uniref:Alpha/beta hydrolase n=1 Tax=Fictibacillus macauensis ZFHKF-1 TaxID=1196324 RepID=I8AJ63_9BACL|nr:alpha/beta hydrolase [Fictibacillus macauensis]EIT85529.1 alpha/beta hydrolase [Fictibacillus macauensis ZFHKF-1]
MKWINHTVTSYSSVSSVHTVIIPYESMLKNGEGAVVMITEKAVGQPVGTVVIVHGAGEHHGRYEWVRQQWQSHGFHVVTGDLPGQGRTTGRRGHISSFAQYVDTIKQWVLEAQEYSLPVFLFGHSMGGLAVITTVMKEPPVVDAIRAVALSSPCLALYHPINKGLDRLSRILNVTLPTVRFHAGLKPQNKTRNQMVLARDEQDPLLVEAVSVRWYRELVEAMTNAHAHAAHFPEIPLFVMQAGDDKIVEKSSVYNWFKEVGHSDKLYKEYPGLYHELLNEPEREDVFNDVLCYFQRLL